MSKKVVYPGITMDSRSAHVTFGNGLVGTGMDDLGRVELVNLLKPKRLNSKVDHKNIDDYPYVIMEFANEKGVDVLIDTLKEVKKNFRKKRK